MVLYGRRQKFCKLIGPFKRILIRIYKVLQVFVIFSSRFLVGFPLWNLEIRTELRVTPGRSLGEGPGNLLIYKLWPKILANLVQNLFQNLLAEFLPSPVPPLPGRWTKTRDILPGGFNACLYLTGLRRIKHITDKKYFGDFFRNFSGYFCRFPDKIYGSGLYRKVREGFSLISSNFHPNPTLGRPEHPQICNSP